jgi:hypothetical protein
MLDSRRRPGPCGNAEEIKGNQRTGAGAYRFGDFDLFPSERQLRRRQRSVRIAPKEFDALLLFVQNAERLVRREQLIEALWPETFVSEANLTNIIVVLRKILGRSAIQTVSKFGYRFCLPVVGEPGIEAGDVRNLPGGQGAGSRAVARVDGARARPVFDLCRHGSSVRLSMGMAGAMRQVPRQVRAAPFGRSPTG